MFSAKYIKNISLQRHGYIKRVALFVQELSRPQFRVIMVRIRPVYMREMFLHSVELLSGDSMWFYKATQN